MKTIITLAFILIVFCHNSFCQLIISNPGTEFNIDFNDFNGSGFSPVPLPGQLNSNTWSITGLSDGNLNFGDARTAANTDFTRGIHNGLTGTGGIYAFNTGNNIILGAQPIGSDFTPGAFTLKLHNLTADTIKSLFLTYDIFILNDQGRGNFLNFSYSVDSINYIPVPSLNFISRDTAALNPTWEKIGKSILLTGVTITPSSFFYFRWDSDDHNGSGNRDEYGIDNISVIANPLPIVANFSAENVCTGTPVNFIDASWSVIDSVISWRWNFGDTTIDSIQHPIHLYQSPGTYTVQLIAKTLTGNEDTLSKTVTIYSIPDAQFSASSISGCAPLQIFFTDSSSTSIGNIFSWDWNFGDALSGALNTNTAADPFHLFNNKGTYVCQLLVTSDVGCVATNSVSITVNSSPHANFGYAITGATSVQFTDSSFISSGNLFYAWNFGDGDTSSVVTPTHNYSSAGAYTVELTVVSENGCIDSTTQLVTIVPSTTGVAESDEKTNFRFYPNPLNSGQLTIETGNSENSEVFITNALGQIVFHKTIGSTVQTLDLSGIQSGVYMIVLISEDQKEAQQLIIQ